MDGEGATKFVSVEVRGAASARDAEVCARTIANSLLCKTFKQKTLHLGKLQSVALFIAITSKQAVSVLEP